MRDYLLIGILSILFVPGTLTAADWRPVTPAELEQKTPRVDPTADAEAVFWDVKIEDRFQGGDLSLTMNHYIRIKIFTDRGKDKYSTVEIAQIGKRTITDVAGRTIKPDGTILELKKDAIFDRDLAKAKGLKLRGKTFALPNVAVGDIIEYRYKEIRNNEVASHMRLYFQRDIPMWNVTYHLKPLNIPYLPYAMRTLSLQCKTPPFQKEPDGFYATTLTNMPAFQEEPNMPPEDQLRAWMLIYYEEDKKIEPEKYWKSVGQSDYSSFKARLGANSDVKRTAAEVASGASSPEEKLAVLDAYCRTKITNLNQAGSRLTAEQRKAIKENHSPGDTLRQKAGWSIDIDLLFAAMANAIGLDARIARIADRGDVFFDRNLPLTYFIDTFSVAVNVAGKWVFYDPSTPYLERGMLRWQEEGTAALVSDPKAGFFVSTQFSQPARSLRRRRASLKLLEDGTLEGTIEYTYTGHTGRNLKAGYDDMTPAQREEDWKTSLRDRLSTAEISDFQMENADDPLKPLIVRHKITVPGYATRTGKRILFQPAFFEHNQAARFTETKRHWPLYFQYGWAEDDEVAIELPEGWGLDQPVQPASSKIADVGEYAVDVRKTVDGRKVIYTRKFDFGRDMKVLLPPTSYATVKKVFDFVQEQDSYTIALKAAANAQ